MGNMSLHTQARACVAKERSTYDSLGAGARAEGRMHAASGPSRGPARASTCGQPAAWPLGWQQHKHSRRCGAGCSCALRRAAQSMTTPSGVVVVGCLGALSVKRNAAGFCSLAGQKVYRRVCVRGGRGRGVLSLCHGTLGGGPRGDRCWPELEGRPQLCRQMLEVREEQVSMRACCASLWVAWRRRRPARRRHVCVVVVVVSVVRERTRSRMREPTGRRPW